MNAGKSKPRGATPAPLQRAGSAGAQEIVDRLLEASAMLFAALLIVNIDFLLL